MRYEFPSEAAARASQNAAFQRIRSLAEARGYTVTGGEIVGKNAKTGEDRPDAQHTTTWAEPVQDGDAWVWPSVRGRFPDDYTDIEARAGTGSPRTPPAESASGKARA